MADFLTSFKITITTEGGYNPGIGEKETYKGIDRGANPHWSGWLIIDALKKANPKISVKLMNATLGANAVLQLNIKNFYLVNYWQPVGLDFVNDQQLANNLFDCSVNQGEGRARGIYQTACNYVIHQIGSKLAALILDSKLGPLSRFAINNLPPAMLMAEINEERKAWYRVAKQYPEWGKLWEERLLPYRKAA